MESLLIFPKSWLIYSYKCEKPDHKCKVYEKCECCAKHLNIPRKYTLLLYAILFHSFILTFHFCFKKRITQDRILISGSVIFTTN